MVAAPDADPARARSRVTLIHDPVAFEGPLVGVAAGLRAARESIVLVVGGDMPTLVGAVIESMLVRARCGQASTRASSTTTDAPGRSRSHSAVSRRWRPRTGSWPTASGACAR